MIAQFADFRLERPSHEGGLSFSTAKMLTKDEARRIEANICEAAGAAAKNLNAAAPAKCGAANIRKLPLFR
jgi:hypothetical protein